MTTYVDFLPTSTTAFSFQATLDGAIYNVVVTWNLAGQRSYVNCYDLSNNLIFTVPMVGSGVGVVLASLTCDLQGNVSATTAFAHTWRVGQTVHLTIAGAVPTGYEGTYDVLITGPMSFTYQVATGGLDPATTAGQVSYDVNLAFGYFTDSTLVFRQADNRFEVSP